MNEIEKVIIKKSYELGWHKNDFKNDKTFVKGFTLLISKNHPNQIKEVLGVLKDCIETDKTKTRLQKDEQKEGLDYIKENFNSILKEAKVIDKKIYTNKIAGNKHLSDCKNVRSF